MTNKNETPRLPSIDGLRAFEVVARLGSLERAGEQLNITASAVSKRIATVEDLIGAPLFERNFNRSGKTLSLTATGTEYLAQVSAALALLQAMPLHQRASQRQQRLRVTAPPTFARQILVPHLVEFTQQHSLVELELVLSIPYLDAATTATRTTADIEIRNGDAKAAGGTPLMQDTLIPMASPKLIAQHPALAHPSDLKTWPLLRTPLEPWTPWFRAAGLNWPEPQSGPKLVDLGLTLEAAVSGQGVVLARPSLARAWVASGALKPLFGITALPVHGYYVMPFEGGGTAQEFAAWVGALCERVADVGLGEALAAQGVS
jgi:LysR family transcriptional regulator, glycine cleavage system transcriptional activator